MSASRPSTRVAPRADLELPACPQALRDDRLTKPSKEQRTHLKQCSKIRNLERHLDYYDWAQDWSERLRLNHWHEIVCGEYDPRVTSDGQNVLSGEDLNLVFSKAQAAKTAILATVATNPRRDYLSDLDLNAAIINGELAVRVIWTRLREGLERSDPETIGRLLMDIATREMPPDDSVGTFCATQHRKMQRVIRSKMDLNLVGTLLILQNIKGEALAPARNALLAGNVRDLDYNSMLSKLQLQEAREKITQPGEEVEQGAEDESFSQSDSEPSESDAINLNELPACPNCNDTSHIKYWDCDKPLKPHLQKRKEEYEEKRAAREAEQKAARESEQKQLVALTQRLDSLAEDLSSSRISKKKRKEKHIVMMLQPHEQHQCSAAASELERKTSFMKAVSTLLALSVGVLIGNSLNNGARTAKYLAQLSVVAPSTVGEAIIGNIHNEDGWNCPMISFSGEDSSHCWRTKSRFNDLASSSDEILGSSEDASSSAEILGSREDIVNFSEENSQNSSTPEKDSKHLPFRSTTQIAAYAANRPTATAIVRRSFREPWCPFSNERCLVHL